MNKNGIKLIALYIAAVIGYLFFVSRFTIPVHLTVDEELYISMAKSFHYRGVFSHEGVILDYTCVLYSMLLSLAYYFGSPRNIVFLFRGIGTVIMLSSVFPVFLLSKRMLGTKKENERTVWAVTILTIFLPSMMNVAYCMQEVLLYPVFLWTIYFVYREMQEGNILKLTGNTVLIAIFSAIGYFTKTLFLFLPLLYCFYIIWEAFRTRHFNIWKKLGVFLGIWLALYGVGKLDIFWLNDGIEGSNHYATQFANLFPVDGQTVLAVLSCIVFYVIALLFYWAVLPVILPLVNWKSYEEQDRKFLKFLVLGIGILIVEIVVSIVITEEGKVMLPHKLLYRYFQMFEVPLLLIYLKGRKKFEFPKWILAIYLTVFTYLGMYFAVLGNQQRLGIIDAPVFLLIDNITRKILPHFNILACVSAAILMGVVWMMYQKGKVKDILKPVHILEIAGMAVIFLINLYQLPYYHNQAAMGTAIQNDAIRIADYISENVSENETVYYLDTQKLAYGRAVYAYLPQEVVCVTREELDNLGRYFLLISDDAEAPGENVDLELQVLNVKKGQ